MNQNHQSCTITVHCKLHFSVLIFVRCSALCLYEICIHFKMDYVWHSPARGKVTRRNTACMSFSLPKITTTIWVAKGREKITPPHTHRMLKHVKNGVASRIAPALR